MLKREEIENIKEMYPAGTRIRLWEMKGETSISAGTKGTVTSVDDIGQIHADWENGSSLAINIEEDRFAIVEPEEEMGEKLMDDFIDKVNEVLVKTDLKKLDASCNGEDIPYARETLFKMHKAFEEVYGGGYVNEDYGMVMMPAVVRGRETGLLSLALVELDLQSSGEHWNTVFISPIGVLEQASEKLEEEERHFIREKYTPYDYWYTPLVEHDHHVDFMHVPESVTAIMQPVDDILVTGEIESMEGPK